LPSRAQPPTDGTADNRTLWTQDKKIWNDYWAAAINSHDEVSRSVLGNEFPHVGQTVARRN
jgi:hypothetical protein